jgi:hypothetical protein
MASRSTSEWLPQVLIESALIVVSILVALALDEWRDERQDAEVVQQSLENFLIEIDQNKVRVEDAAPFNQGLHSVLTSYYMDDDLESVDEFVDMVESYSPAVLQSTAWDTALATGTLSKMDYNLVRVLSLTYGVQSRYQTTTVSGMNNLISPLNLSADRLRLALYNSMRYLEGVTTLEQELADTYGEAAPIIEQGLVEMRKAQEGD